MTGLYDGMVDDIISISTCDLDSVITTVHLNSKTSRSYNTATLLEDLARREAVAVADMMIIQTFQVGEDSRDPLR